MKYLNEKKTQIMRFQNDHDMYIYKEREKRATKKQMRLFFHSYHVLRLDPQHCLAVRGSAPVLLEAASCFGPPQQRFHVGRLDLEHRRTVSDNVLPPGARVYMYEACMCVHV